MHITLIAVGSQGDALPFIALGGGLKRAGYQVRLATHPEFEPLARAERLDYFPISISPREIVRQEMASAWMRTGRNSIAFMRFFLKLGRQVADQINGDILRACDDTHAVVYSLLGSAAFYVAEKRRLPAIAATFQPFTPTGIYPPMVLPFEWKMGARFNRLAHWAMLYGFWMGVRSVAERWRKRALGSARRMRLGAFAPFISDTIPVLYPYSPTVLPRPADWPSSHHVTGYWVSNNTAWQPPEALAKFLSSGPAPVYVGFGSMVNGNPAHTTEIVLEALRRSGQRGVLATGWGGLVADDLPPDVFAIESAPHDWLFPHMAAVVHHSGAGTTGAGLRAGVPNIAVPHFADQPFWAQRIAALGAGPTPIPRKRLTAERLADAITEAVENESIRARAAELGARLRSEDGVARAVELISEYLHRRD